MLRPCILKARALYLTGVEKVSEQYLHLLKIERISSDKASNLPKRDVHFILLI